jgi:hypothetical protein
LKVLGYYPAMPEPDHAWQAAFVGVTVLLGGSLEDARASLAPSDWAAAVDTATGLGDGRRERRARALALVMGDIVRELTELRLV